MQRPSARRAHGLKQAMWLEPENGRVREARGSQEGQQGPDARVWTQQDLALLKGIGIPFTVSK